MSFDVTLPSPAGGRGAGGEGGRRSVREGQKTKVARRLRKTANASEQKAWQALRQLRRHGYPVRRQHPIGPYIVDFAIVKERLVIEIDGGIHRFAEKVAADAERQSVIEQAGWRVLRFPPEQAISPDHLLLAVQDAIANLPSPPTPLPPAGEGGET